MALPINSSTPVYTLTVPSTEQLVKFRPFLIKEEKALLIAQQSEDQIVMVDSLKEVIKSCIKDDINVDALATFDLEYIFTQLRAKSVGEIIDLQLRCDTCTDEKAVAPVKIDLTTLKVIKSEEHTNKIELYDDVGIMLKYPTVEVIKKLEALDQTDIDSVFSVIVESIDFIYTSTEVFHAKEQSKQELTDFLNNLTSDQFMKIQKFFETMPRLSHPVNYNCPVCGKEHNKVLEGLASFF
jgi:hypothetical protein